MPDEPRRFAVTADGKVIHAEDATEGGQIIHIEGDQLDEALITARYGEDVLKELKSAMSGRRAKAVAESEVEDKEAPRPRSRGE